jgi:hypothetical protein
MQRLDAINSHFGPTLTANKESLTVVDNRTGTLITTHHIPNLFIIIGKTYELPIKDGAINATDLSKIKD